MLATTSGFSKARARSLVSLTANMLNGGVGEEGQENRRDARQCEQIVGDERDRRKERRSDAKSKGQDKHDPKAVKSALHFRCLDAA